MHIGTTIAKPKVVKYDIGDRKFSNTYGTLQRLNVAHAKFDIGSRRIVADCSDAGLIGRVLSASTDSDSVVADNADYHLVNPTGFNAMPKSVLVHGVNKPAQMYIDMHYLGCSSEVLDTAANRHPDGRRQNWLRLSRAKCNVNGYEFEFAAAPPCIYEAYQDFYKDALGNILAIPSFDIDAWVEEKMKAAPENKIDRYFRIGVPSMRQVTRACFLLGLIQLRDHGDTCFIDFKPLTHLHPDRRAALSIVRETINMEATIYTSCSEVWDFSNPISVANGH